MPTSTPKDPPESPPKDARGVIELRSERTDLGALLSSSLAPLIAQSAEEEIECRVVADAGVPPAMVDPDKIAWAIATLVGNALRYLRTGNSQEIGGSVLIHLAAQPGEIHIAVQDDGPGIPKDKLPLLFERGPGAQHATGLALSLVKDIVAAHGGRLEVQSCRGDEEHYTCVTIVLPSAPP